MMASITHCWRNARLEWVALLAFVLITCGVHLPASAQSQPTEISQFRLERSHDGIFLSASVKFELPFAVEDALLKGVPMFFVAQADVSRERWYWIDKRLLTAERHMRLAYQPLTRRWRLNVASGAITNNSLGLALNQSFDSLAEALAAVQRLPRWKIADAPDLEADARYAVDFRFFLDISQLPRPFQIGVLGQSDWSISTFTNQRLAPEGLR